MLIIVVVEVAGVVLQGFTLKGVTNILPLSWM